MGHMTETLPRAGLLDKILPPAVVAIDVFDDTNVRLHPEEEAAIARAVQPRRREYTTVRLCARLAMARLGVAPTPVLSGHLGAPRWPAGLVGSMTHCPGYRAAAVARQGSVRVLGIDAEPNLPLPGGLLPGISLPTERIILEFLTETTREVQWDRLLFSAKESVYKAWFPLAERMLDFTDAEVLLRSDGSFAARLLVPGPLVGPDRQVAGFDGRWLNHGRLLVTAVVALVCMP